MVERQVEVGRKEGGNRDMRGGVGGGGKGSWG